MKSFKISIILLLCVLVQSCQTQNCPEGINLLPMYGEKEKCKEQIDFDNQFLQETDKSFKTRSEASKYFSAKGWEYFYKDDSDTAVKRFNQAWLLDKSNYEVYWGFGNIYGKAGKENEALKMFNLAKQHNPENANFYISSASAYGALYNKKQSSTILSKMIEDLNKASAIDPKNARAYAELAAAYTYINQKDKAKEYLKLAENIDPNVVNPELKKMLKD